MARVGICGSRVLGNSRDALGTLSVLGEAVQSAQGSSHGKQASCQSSAEYLSADRNHSCFLAMIVAIVSVAAFVMP